MTPTMQILLRQQIRKILSRVHLKFELQNDRDKQDVNVNFIPFYQSAIRAETKNLPVHQAVVTIMAGVDEETPRDAVWSLLEAGATRVILAIGTVTTDKTVREQDRERHPLAPGRYEETLDDAAARFLGPA